VNPLQSRNQIPKTKMTALGEDRAESAGQQRRTSFVSETTLEQLGQEDQVLDKAISFLGHRAGLKLRLQSRPRQKDVSPLIRRA